MKIIRVTYFALATLFSVASCSKEATEPDVYDWQDGDIYFRPTLSDVATSRAQDMTLDILESFQVTCFNSADRIKDRYGYISPYFENERFVRNIKGTFESAREDGPNWPSNNGVLSFFAFSPSVSEMASNSAVEDENHSSYFNLINRTTESQSVVSVDYRIGRFRINSNISKQFDFITAAAKGTRLKDFMGGIDIAFRHQLCQIELRAWGANENYDFEIAGVRIGNPVVEGEFVFDDSSPLDTSGTWEIADNTIKDKVEYEYQANDNIYRINGAEHDQPQHNTEDSAKSIMGLGGCAMVMPTINTKWEGTDDQNIGTTPYSTDKMYFSILLRVTDRETGSVVYPYPGNPTGMSVVNYAVDRYSGKVTTPLSGHEGNYKTPDGRPYRPGPRDETKDFGWAAVPVDVDWKAGKKYVYTLNYSEGIGLHDPEDPEPGKLIVGQTPIEWSVSVSDWDYAEKNDNFDPDLDVP